MALSQESANFFSADVRRGESGPDISMFASSTYFRPRIPPSAARMTILRRAASAWSYTAASFSSVHALHLELQLTLRIPSVGRDHLFHQVLVVLDEGTGQGLGALAEHVSLPETFGHRGDRVGDGVGEVGGLAVLLAHVLLGGDEQTAVLDRVEDHLQVVGDQLVLVHQLHRAVAHLLAKLLEPVRA